MRDTAPTVFNDKQSITADPTNASYVYAVWDRLVFPASERASVVASFRTSAFSGPDVVRPVYGRGPHVGGRRGRSGIPASRIRRSATRSSSSRTGRWSTSSPSSTTRTPRNTAAASSASCARPTRARPGQARTTSHGSGRSESPIPRRAMTSGRGTSSRTSRSTLPTAASMPSGRTQASTTTRQTRSRSRSRSTAVSPGRTPIKVNETPTRIPIGNQQAFTPSVDVSANGTVAVTYYDFRNNTGAPPLLTDYFIVHCHPATPTACASASNWGTEARLTDSVVRHASGPRCRRLLHRRLRGSRERGRRFHGVLLATTRRRPVEHILPASRLKKRSI